MNRIINKIYRFFNTECPESFTHYSPRLTSVGIFVMVFISLLIFQPFKLYILERDIMLGLIIGYAIIPSTVFLLTYAFVNPSSKSYKWTIFMDVVWVFTIFVLSGLLIFVYSYIIFNFFYITPGENHVLLIEESLLYTVIIGLIIYIFFKLLDWIFYLKKTINLGDQLIEKPISINAGEKIENNVSEKDQESIPIITINGKNINEELIVAVNRVLCVKAIGNYLNIFLITKDNTIKKRTIRNSLGNIWDILSQYDFFYQCHRSYIININEIVNIKGTSKKMTARVRDLDEIIPIARKNIKEIKEIFNKFV